MEGGGGGGVPKGPRIGGNGAREARTGHGP